MLHKHYPHWYQTLKWQALVPDDQTFTFADGQQVQTLFEFYNHLTTAKESVVSQHLQAKDFSNWVKQSIGHEKLASGIETVKHRWGLIVTIERVMDQTPNLPSYLAQKMLAPNKLPFAFKTGQSVSSLAELVEALKNINQPTLDFHNQRHPSDLSNWYKNSIGDPEFSKLIEEIPSRVMLIHMLEDRIQLLSISSNQ